MSTPHSPHDDSGPGFYSIRIRGHLDDRWGDRFRGLTITRTESGDTVLAGWVVDQPALYGLLRKVRDLGMPLLAVMREESDTADGGPDSPLA